MAETTQEQYAETPGAGIRFDWSAYFREFSVKHGGNPILHEGRLLFPDGWSYSSNSHRGPERPPPRDPILQARLTFTYWTKRRDVVESQRFSLADALEEVKNLQATRSAPLMYRVPVRDEATGKMGMKSIKFSPEGMEKRLEWLTADVQECDRRIGELRADLASVEVPTNDLQTRT